MQRRYLIFLIIIILIVIVLYHIYQDNVLVANIDSSGSSNGIPSSSLSYKKHKETSNYTSINDGAYAFLSMGAQSNQLNCIASIESLVRYGGWDGHVYLITDRDYCYDKKTIVNYANMDDDKLHIVQIDEDLSSGIIIININIIIIVIITIIIII